MRHLSCLRHLIGGARRDVPDPDDPPMPQDVRVVYADGREVPVELVYRGVDEHGLHCWQAVLPLGEQPHKLRAAVLPGRTRITVGWRDH